MNCKKFCLQPIYSISAPQGSAAVMLVFSRNIIHRAIGNGHIFNNIVSIGDQVRQVQQMPLMSPMEREVRLQAAKGIVGDIRLERIIGPNVGATQWHESAERLSTEGPTVEEQRYAARSLESVRAVNTEGRFLDLQVDADFVASEIEADINVEAVEYNNFLFANELRAYQDAFRDGKAVFDLQIDEPEPILPEPNPPLTVERGWNVDTARETIVKKLRILRASLVDGDSLDSDPSAVSMALAGNPGVGGNPKLPARLATKIADFSVCDKKIYIYPENHPSVAVFRGVIQRQSTNLNRPVVAEIVPGVSFQQIMDALNLLISFFV